MNFIRSKSGKCLIVAGVICLLASFAPFLYMVTWSASHSRHFRLEGFTFDVPVGWVGETKFKGVKFEHYAPTVWDERFAFIDIDSDRPPRHGMSDADSMASWKKLNLIFFPADRYTPVAVKEFQAPLSGVCMEYRFLVVGTRVSCLFPSSNLSATYIGETKHVDSFYDAIQSAHR